MPKADPQKISKRLRDQAKDQDRQREQLLEQLTITDAIIDEYDELILKLDGLNPELISEINVKIKAVADAYKARISAGCRNDLAWVAVQENSFWTRISGSPGRVTVTTYECKKDPAQRVQLNNYGIKYYRHPKNREYGAGVVDEIQDASIDKLSSVLVLFGDLAGSYAGVVAVGDYITDDLEEPQVWPTGNLPRVVSVGTTNYPGEQSTVSGFCTSGVSRLYGDGVVGVLSDFNVGDYVIAEGYFPLNTTITGFGEAEYQQDFIDDVGVTTTITTSIFYADLSNVAIGETNNHDFTVGIVSSYNALFLSTSTDVGAARSSFLIVRPPDAGDLDFEVTKNPIDPVEIGIVKGKKTGKGHRVQLINNGDPDVVKNWHSVREDPEPPVGAGYEEYWTGNFAWPTLETTTITGYAGSDPIFSSFINYATEGQRVSISVGTTTPQSKIGTTSVSPTNPGGSGCGALDSAISTAESQMNSKIAENTPKVNHNLGGTQALRNLRDEEETQAWGYLQGIAYINDKKKKLNNSATAISDFNWSTIE
jgi:hypothetical protein